MTQNDVTRHRAVAIAALIREQLDAAYAKALAADKPDPRVIENFRGAHDLRRSARRLRSGDFRPKWMTESPEELAREYDYAAEYADMMVTLRRLTKAQKDVQLHIANGTFAEVVAVLNRMKEWLFDS